jgi:hypothetical protein
MTDWPESSRLPDPRDRVETEAWLERRAAVLAEKIARSLKKVVTSAYEEYLKTIPETSIVSSLTAAGDLHAFDSIIGRWRLIYEREIEPELEEVYLSGALSAFTQAPGTDAMTEAEVASWARVTNDQAVSYMSAASNRLSGVGETIWTDVREKVTRAVASGMSNEELKDQVQKLGNFSEYRADTIARTETIGAYVNGDWEGAQLLGEFGPVEKVWVATGDARGRDWHTALTDTSLPMDEPFDVDGEPMLYPHDPSGSSFNVVNCRCYIEFLYAGDTRPDGSIVSERGTEEETEAAAEEVIIEEEIAPPSFGGDFESGAWVEIDETNLEEFIDGWTRGKDDLSKRVMGDSMRQQVQRATRTSVNGEVVVMDSVGVAKEAFDLLVTEVDGLRTTNPQAGGRLIVEVHRFKNSGTLGDCDMARYAEQSQRLRISADNLSSEALVPMTGWKQASIPVQQRLWTIAHEWGHAIDTEDFPTTGRNLFFGKMKKIPGEPPDGMSRYGRTSKYEGYAESFADWWTTRGQSTNPVTQAYAQKYGWKVP